MRGYLPVYLLDGGHSPIGTLATRTGEGFASAPLRVRTVRLRTGEKASFELFYGEEPSVLGPKNRACEVISWLGIRLLGGRLDVATEMSPCGGRFNQSPVQRGVLPHPPRQ
jgi:hypothetical protein